MKILSGESMVKHLKNEKATAMVIRLYVAQLNKGLLRDWVKMKGSKNKANQQGSAQSGEHA